MRKHVTRTEGVRWKAGASLYCRARLQFILDALAQRALGLKIERRLIRRPGFRRMLRSRFQIADALK